MYLLVKAVKRGEIVEQVLKFWKRPRQTKLSIRPETCCSERGKVAKRISSQWMLDIEIVVPDQHDADLPIRGKADDEAALQQANQNVPSQSGDLHYPCSDEDQDHEQDGLWRQLQHQYQQPHVETPRRHNPDN